MNIKLKKFLLTLVLLVTLLDHSQQRTSLLKQAHLNPKENSQNYQDQQDDTRSTHILEEYFAKNEELQQNQELLLKFPSQDQPSETRNLKSTSNQITYGNLRKPLPSVKQSSAVNMTWISSFIQNTSSLILNAYGTQRIQMTIISDKVLYRPNDVIFIEGFITDVYNKTPVGLDLVSYYYNSYYFTLDVLDPSETVIYTSYNQAQGSTVSFTFKVPDDVMGGEYLIRLESYSIPTAYKLIRIADYPRSALTVTADLSQDSYYPGNTVYGKLTAKTIDGTAFTTAPTYDYSVEFETGETVSKTGNVLSMQGQGVFSFTIPSDTSLLTASIAFIVTYGSIQQVYSQTLVIGNPSLFTIDFFPDTGLYVQGVTNVIYFQAYTSDARSDFVSFSGAYVVGWKTNVNNPKIVTYAKNITTIHEGKGQFNFIPQANMSYNFTINIGMNGQTISTPMYLPGYTFSYPIPYTPLASGSSDADNGGGDVIGPIMGVGPVINNNKEKVKKTAAILPNDTAIIWPGYYSDNEIVFRIVNPNKVLDNNDDLQIAFLTNNMLQANSTYMITVSLKDEILYSQSMNITGPSSLIIPNSQFSVVNGGILQVNLYLLTQEIILYCSTQASTNYKKAPNAEDVYYSQSSSSNSYYGYAYDRKTKKVVNSSIPMPDVQYWQQPKGESTFFLRPSNVLSLQITPSQTQYAPGSRVDVDISIINNITGQVDTSATAYVSVYVTDDSVFYKVDSKYQMPSFASAVYLKYDLLNSDYEIPYVNDYIDHIYMASANYSSDSNLELIMSIQQWRTCIFCIRNVMELQDLLTASNDSYSSQVQNLFGYYYYDYSYYDYAGVAEDGVVPMDAAAGVAGAAANSGTAVQKGGADTSSSSSSSSSTSGSDSTSSSTSDSSSAFNIEEQDQDFMTGITDNTRQYVHKLRKGYNPSQRIDFTETIYYQTAAKTVNGRVKASFYLSDLITQFRITANAFDVNGAIGFSQQLFQTQQPFYIQFALPTSICVSDQLTVPVYLNNLLSSSAKVTLQIQFNSAVSVTLAKKTVTVGANSNSQVNLVLNGLNINTTAYVYVMATAVIGQQNYSDSLVQYTQVVPQGFSQSSSTGGYIGTNIAGNNNISSTITYQFTIPSTYESGSIQVKANILSSSYATLVEAVAALIQDPYGCFEQASATTYPMVLALEFLNTQDSTNEDIVNMKIDINSKLVAGYKLLTSYQSPDKGYEWFGDNPANEPLTAYGLMQFQEMKNSTTLVDDQMLAQATNWLISRKDGKGGFLQSTEALDSFGAAPLNITNAYIVWALTASGYTNLTTEINALIALAKTSTDPYFLGLLSASLYNLNMTSQGQQYADQLLQYQTSFGNVTGAQTSVTQSQGIDLTIETTSICAIAWLNNQSRYSSNIQSAVNWLAGQVQQGGRYGSTQATILALKAITSFISTFVGINGNGTFTLHLNGNAIQQIAFSEDVKDTISFDISSYIWAHQKDIFKAGQQLTFQISIDNYTPTNSDSPDFKVQYAIGITYSSLVPPTVQSSLAFTATKLFSSTAMGTTAMFGQEFKYQLTYTNTNSSAGFGMMVSIFRIPSCLIIDYNLLSQMSNSGELDYYEVSSDSSEIYMYWRSFAPSETKTVYIGFVQGYNGVCYQKPHNAYLYYYSQNIVWVPMSSS